jgi:HK97 family phage major capsid protein
MSDNGQQDALIARLEGDIAERNSLIQGIIGGAQDASRSLTDTEKQMITSAKEVVDDAASQLDILYDSRNSTMKARERAREVGRELAKLRDNFDSPVEYRSAGAYLLDAYRAGVGHRDAKDRLEFFERAAAHDKTGDNLGVIPTPILGPVVDFIDAARPIVNILGPRAMPSATWSRPLVTQHTSVAVQGSAGGAADEKTELVSQKLTISKLTANAVTYGGYVNVSRQVIDFSTPEVFDVIVNDLAAQYSIQTEAALGTSLAGSSNTIELAGTGSAAFTAANLGAALWTAAGNIYTATKGQGTVVCACSPDQLGNWGNAFAAYVNPFNALSPGLKASNFGQGLMGYVAGIPVYCSAGLPSGTIGVVLSTAAVEVYEQRVGTLQITEPSVLGVQVAYAGYFTPLTITSAGVQKIVNAT